MEEYSNARNKDTSAKELAFKFRRPNDFEIAKIIADSDLKSVSPTFYERLKHCLTDDNLKPIQNYLDKLYSTGNILFTDKIVAPKKIKTQSIKGKEYKIINLHEIGDDEDIMKYGFDINKKKKDLNLLVHMVDSNIIYHSLNTVKLLSSALNGGVLSESLINPQCTNTYGKRKYGVVLSQINTNIINTDKANQGSGYAKDIKKAISEVFNHYSYASRMNFRKNT